MDTLDRLKSMLGDIPEDPLEIRLRAGKPAQYRCIGGEFFGETIPADRLRSILSALADHSLYARETEMAEGFFTMGDGCRVGVCGRLINDGEHPARMAAVGSVCIRVCREIRGASDGFYGALLDERTCAPRPTLIASPPGMGKTTALRDAARRLSEDGYDVCIADERHELAACVDGVPTLDVGPRTDVMDGCPKQIAIRHLLRAASPQVIVTDEIGSAQDADALAEASRCGVCILASAHAGSIEQLMRRRHIPMEVFSLVVLLGDAPGEVKEIREL